MSRDDELELAGDFWDSLPTGKRLKLGVIVLALLYEAVAVTHTLDQQIHENKLSSVKAKYEGDMLQQKREGAKSVSPSFSIGISVSDPGADAPASTNSGR